MKNSKEKVNSTKDKKPISKLNSININKEQNNPLLTNQINKKQIKKKESMKKNINKFEKSKKENILLITNESSYFVLESFLKEHQIKYTSLFILYLSEIWRELSLYSSDHNQGIIHFAFSRFFPLQGLISKRLFDVLDKNKDGQLSPKDFIQGLTTIFCEEICTLIEFIFLFYDFDYDGYITSEDIHAIMSYIPVINSFDDMIDIEEEIQNTLEEIFIDENKKIDLFEFTDLIINKERYEIFIPIISFFFEQKPFSNQQIYYFYKNVLNDIDYNNNENNYKIEGKIKLKITKEEITNENNENKKIIFEFDKNKYNDVSIITNGNDNNDNSKKMSLSNNSIKEEEKNNNDVSNINNDNDTTNNNINNEVHVNIVDSYIENNDNINIIGTESEEKDESNIINDNNDLNLKRIPFSDDKDFNNIFEINLRNLNNKYINTKKSEGIKKTEISSFSNNKEKDRIGRNNFYESIDEDHKKLNYYRNRTRSMKNTRKIKNKNLEDLLSKSRGFRHLQKSIPSLINKTKILSKFSSKNNKIYENEGLNKYKKGNVIKDLCKSKINYDNEKSYINDDRRITEDSYEVERNDANEFIGIKYVMNNQKEESEKNIRIQSKETLNNKFMYESYLYKITPNTKKLKKLYFKLYDKNLYYYKNEKSPIHKGMHNLCHYFLELTEDNDNESDSNKKLVDKNNTSHSQEEEEDESYLETEKSNPDNKIIIKTINSVDYYCFVLISQKGKVQWYLTPEIDIYNKWVELLKELMNYKDILNEYEFKEVTGKGKFSVVYCAYDKKNKRKVAIKRIDKTLLKLPELELIKTEIDILKICQHPYVIGLYDVIETYNTMDIILEYCQIGNLFNYLYKKNFNLTEQQIVTYIHKISKAVYSMHNLGIIHRDLKLSNIAMANEKEEDIRILDFGLSKIIGPGEYCSESYGTPGYASPEVINEEEYRFKADVWSIGAIAYIMCTSKLPFDYPTKGLNKANIILNTLNDELKFNEDCWKKYSKEAIKFIKACMNKNTEKRLNIKQVLEHEWIKKYFYMEVKNRESSNNHEIEKKKTYQKIDSLGSPYRLYAAISSEI